MNIVIIGDGKVGHKLAVSLSQEEYDVVLIDQNENRVKSSVDRLDVMCIQGNGADVDAQTRAGVPEADIVIACASADELNMFSCLLAKRLGAARTIARVRNPIYYKQMDLLKEDLRLSMAVNPELAAANEIARVLIFPDVNKVEIFFKGRIELVEHGLSENSPLIGLSLAQIYQKLKINVLICAIKRGEHVIIPDGNTVIKNGDVLHIAASHESLEHFFKTLGNKARKIKKVLICGGGHISYYLAKELISLRMKVKIIEINRERAEQLSDLLPEADIICGDATKAELLKEERIGEADALVSLTGIDEENMITALYAQSQNIPKVVAKINDDSLDQMARGLGINSTISAKSVTADAIVSYVRAMNNSAESSNILTLYRLVNEQVEAAEILIEKEADFINVPLRDLKMKPNCLIACIGRGKRILIPGGNDSIQVGDSVIVITSNQGIDDFTDILM